MPVPPPAPTTPASPSAERILEQATELFAEHGYHGVTTRRIAQAVGLNVATVNHHVGSKRELYLRVIERLYREDRAMVEAWRAPTLTESPKTADDLLKLLCKLLDRYIDRMGRDPTRLRLYLRRWLEPKDEMSHFESEMSLKLYRPIVELLADARERGIVTVDVDFLMLLRGVDWLTYGYFVGGPLQQKRLRGDPSDTCNRVRFRGYVHQYVQRMLGL